MDIVDCLSACAALADDVSVVDIAGKIEMQVNMRSVIGYSSSAVAPV